MKRLRDNKGMTLIELIISMAILSLILVVFVGILSTGLNISLGTSQGVKGSMTAASQLENGNGARWEEDEGQGLELNFYVGEEASPNTTIKVQGEYWVAENNGVQYTHFRPNPSSSEEEELEGERVIGQSSGCDDGCSDCEKWLRKQIVQLNQNQSSEVIKFIKEKYKVSENDITFLETRTKQAGEENKYYIKGELRRNNKVEKVMFNFSIFKDGSIKKVGVIDKRICQRCGCESPSHKCHNR